MYSFMSDAQTDSIKYYNEDWELTTKDSAYYYSVISYADSLYKTKDYFAKTNKLQMEGAYLDKNREVLQGLFKWYYENGVMRDSVFYNKGKTLRGWSFYDNGNKRAAYTVVDNSIIAQGWDEHGKEMQDFIFERPAEFPGGLTAWKRYLEKHLDRNTAAKARAPIGDYTVKVNFTVGKDGKLSNVTAASYPYNCVPCAIEAVRVIEKGPDWIPAVQFGRPVLYKAIQYVTFQVSNR